MAYTRVQSFFILTLLQLCRTETSSNVSESWYLANLINERYQPKSISEIFSTESTFSQTNPIVVGPQTTSQQNPETSISSTIPPPTSFQNTQIYNVSPLHSSTHTPTQGEISQFTEQTHPTLALQSRPTIPEQTSPSTRTLPQESTVTLLQQSSIAGRFLIPLGNVAELPSTQQQPVPSSTPTALTGSFVIYQNDGSRNGPGQDPTVQGGLFDTTVPQQVNTFRGPGSTVAPQWTSTINPPQPTPTYQRLTTVQSTVQGVQTSSRPASSGPTHFPSSERPLNQRYGFPHPNRNVYGSTHVDPFGNLPLRVRVVGPRGAITNVNINPRVVVVPTTTTTKRPTTTRTRKTPKPKKNTYEGCLNGCKTRRDPICAVPLSATWIDPDKLKGFPSVCHMACHNSYRKDAYEKFLDGRCGRLRTRIHSLDSNTKLKRDELNKAQYTVDGGDQTIVEVSPIYKK